MPSMETTTKKFYCVKLAAKQCDPGVILGTDGIFMLKSFSANLHRNDHRLNLPSLSSPLLHIILGTVPHSDLLCWCNNL